MSEQGFTLFKPIYIDALVSHLQAQLKRAMKQVTPALIEAGVSLDEQAQCLRQQTQAIDSFLRQFKTQLQYPDPANIQLDTAQHYLLHAVIQADPVYLTLIASYPSAVLLPAEHAADAMNSALLAPVLLRLWLKAVANLTLSLQAKVTMLKQWLQQLPSAQNDIGGLVEAWLRRAHAVAYSDKHALQLLWQQQLDALQQPYPVLAAAELDQQWQSLLDAKQQAQLEALLSALTDDQLSADRSLAFAAAYAAHHLQQQPLSLLLPLNAQPALNTLSLLPQHRRAHDWLTLIDFLQQTDQRINAQVESLACAAKLSAQLKTARAGIVELLQERLGGAAWPRLVCDIVDEHWLPMLLEIDWRYGRASSQWLTALTVLDELLAMLEPELPLATRLEMSEQLPQLLTKLRSLLVADASVDLVRRRQSRQMFSQLLDRLAEIHLALMQGESWPDSQLWQVPIEPALPVLAQANWWRDQNAGLICCLYRDDAQAVVIALATGRVQLLPLSEMVECEWQAVA